MAEVGTPKVDMIPAGDREAWLKLRERDVTASAAASLVDAHPYVSRFQLWLHKAGKLADPEMTPAMERGVLLEPVAFQLLQKLRPDWQLTHNTGANQIYLREAATRIGCTPDVIAKVEAQRATVQIKTVATYAFEASWLVEGKLSKPASWVVEPPAYVAIQAVVEAYLTGSRRVFVAPLVWTDGLYLPIVEVPVHMGIIERLKGEVREFWQSIASGIEPEPDYAKDNELLNELGRRDNGLEIDLRRDNELPGWLEERAILKQIIKDAEAKLEPINDGIVNKIGAFERAVFPGWSIKRPTIERSGYTVKPGQYRRLDIRPTKG